MNVSEAIASRPPAGQVAAPPAGRVAAVLLALLIAACATQPPSYRRGWSLRADAGTARLAYGSTGSDQPDLLAECAGDRFALTFRTGDEDGPARPGRRTELLIGPPDKVRSVPAWTGRSEAGGLLVTARAEMPPVPLVADWAGRRITVAAEGRAATLLARPAPAMIAAFVKACGR